MTSNRSARLRLWNSGHKYCAYCGVPVTINKERNLNHLLTIDHILPRVKGGITKEDNILVACNRCNNAKGDSYFNQSHCTLTGKVLNMGDSKRNDFKEG